jgi:hypothetical protein
MSNKDLLKQAIAEAKTIREAAIANAKEALEETLTPHLKDMLAAKLQEMEEKEDEEVMDENIYEAEEEEVEAEEGEEAEEEGAEEKEGNEEEELEIEDMSVEDLKELIRDIVAQETGNDETEEELPGEEAPEGEDLTSMDSEEEIDINELLAELDEMDNSKNKMKEYSSGKVDPMPMFSGLETGKELDTQLINAVKSAAKKAGMSVADFYKKYIAETPGEPMMQRESEELNEALKAVKILRNQLQEVNLLNAKLLYVNKVFKSTNLSEGQKVNVIAAFDKAETVKEVKLVFETVSKNVVAKPATIKEHRSFASKATGNAQTTAPKQILSEVDEQVQRWQKLAGIIKS